MITGSQTEGEQLRLRTRKCKQPGVTPPIDPKTLLEVERVRINMRGANKRKKIKKRNKGIGSHSTTRTEAVEGGKQSQKGLPTQEKSPKRQKTNVRRKIKKTSETVLSPAVLKTKLFFQRQIEAYYPTYLSPQQLSIIDNLIYQGSAVHQNNPSRNLQTLLKMDASEVLRTLTPITKQDGQVVSIMIRRPNLSAIMYFKPSEQFNVQQKDVNQMEMEERQVLEQPENVDLQLNRVDFLNPEEGLEIQKRTVFMQCQKYQQNFQNNTQIENEIDFWRTCADIQRQMSMERLKRLKSSIEEEMRNQNNKIPFGMDSYITKLIRKNMSKSLEDQPLETKNYFNLKANQQYDSAYCQKSQPKQQKSYISKRLKRATRKKVPLTTSCLGCLGNFFQLSNTFKHCCRCGTRMHRMCNMLVGNKQCTICIRKNHKKFGLRECTLCPNRGLAFRIMPGGNIHIFCIIFFGLYEIKDNVAHINPNNLDQINNPFECLICQSTRGPMVSCQCDIHHYHPLCAYLAGYRFDRQQNNIFIDCQTSQNQRHLLLFNRKYRANLNKFAVNYVNFQQYMEPKTVSNNKTKIAQLEQQLEDEEVVQEVKQTGAMDLELSAQNITTL